MLKNKRYLDVKGVVPIRLNPRGGQGGGGYSWEFLVGVCRWAKKILTQFQTRKCHIHTLFPIWPLMHNIITLD